MTHVLKLCRKLDVAPTACARLNSVRKLCLWRASTSYTCHSVLLQHTKRVDGQGRSSFCTSSRHLVPLPQTPGGYKQNTGCVMPDKISKYGGSREEARFKYANSRFRPTLFAVGGVLIGGVLLNIIDEEEDESLKDNTAHTGDKTLTVEEAAKVTEDLLQRIKDESNSPGLVAMVSKDGFAMPTRQAFGYADVENKVLCKPDSVFRIASISKSITMAAVARLCENGELDLDKPVQHYVPEFPEKTWKGEKVTITTRMLLCHMAGIRHYGRTYINNRTSKEGTKKSEFEEEEYYIMDPYPSVAQSLDLFKDDPLVNKPGSEFFYTTHGWTLISAVVESVADMPFRKYLEEFLYEWRLDDTYFEEQIKLIKNRGKHYVRNAQGQLENAPYTDLSYKWAGGGLVSTVDDLNHFGAIMLYSYQATQDGTQGRGYLEQETVKEMWTKVDKTNVNWGMGGGGYGLGWAVWDIQQKHGRCKKGQSFVAHTGGAVGASSVLLIVPTQKVDPSKKLPQGVVVSIVVNMTSVKLLKTAHEIAKVWERVPRRELINRNLSQLYF